MSDISDELDNIPETVRNNKQIISYIKYDKEGNILSKYNKVNNNWIKVPDEELAKINKKRHLSKIADDERLKLRPNKELLSRIDADEIERAEELLAELRQSLTITEDYDDEPWEED